MPAFVEKYNDDQRDAMAYAFEDRKIRPAQRVVELAARGELTHRGEKLPPFEANPESVRHYARLARRRRAGRIRSELADKPHDDSMEILRKRIVNCADAVLTAFEKKLKRSPEKAQTKELTEIAALMVALQRLDPTPETRRAAHTKTDPRTGKTGTKAVGPLAGALLKAHRTEDAADPSPRTTLDNTDDAYGEQGAQSEATGATEPSTEQHDDDVPGSWARVGLTQLSSSSP